MSAVLSLLAARDPAPLFKDPRVEDLLQRVTGLNLDKVFQEKPTTEYGAPQYKLLTDKQLREVRAHYLFGTEQGHHIVFSIIYNRLICVLRQA